MTPELSRDERDPKVLAQYIADCASLAVAEFGGDWEEAALEATEQVRDELDLEECEAADALEAALRLRP